MVCSRFSTKYWYIYRLNCLVLLKYWNHLMVYEQDSLIKRLFFLLTNWNEIWLKSFVYGTFSWNWKYAIENQIRIRSMSFCGKSHFRKRRVIAAKLFVSTFDANKQIPKSILALTFFVKNSIFFDETINRHNK